MDAKTKSPVMLYTEQTPNPETLKYVTNKMLYKGTAEFRSVRRHWVVAFALEHGHLLVGRLGGLQCYRNDQQRAYRHQVRILCDLGVEVQNGLQWEPGQRRQ